MRESSEYYSAISGLPILFETHNLWLLSPEMSPFYIKKKLKKYKVCRTIK